MKEYLNRKEYPNGDITVKLVKMGMDIDDTRNHRVRGIIKTEDNKYLFIEILQGRRIPRKYTSMKSKEYFKKYPNEEYIWIDGCFRVDIPEDYFRNYTPEFSKYDRHSFYEYEHSKENIIKILQIFNKDIKNIELVDNNYIDEYCDKNGFYRLYDKRLEHTLTPIDIFDIRKNKIIFDMEYCCVNYNKTIPYKEKIQETYDYNLDELTKEFGKEKMNKLLANYKKENSLEYLLAKRQEKDTEIEYEL